MSQDDDQLVERVAMIIAKHVFTERASEWPYAGKEEEIRGRLQRAARAALSALPERELLAEALEALAPFAKEAAEWGVNGKPLPDDFQIEVREAGYPATPALFNLGDLRRARAAADKLRAALEQQQKGEKL